MKTCIKCKEEKSLNFFSKDAKRTDGLQPCCKACNAIYRSANKENISKWGRGYRKRPDVAIVRAEYQEKYYAENREKILDQKKEYFSRDDVKIKKKEYLEKNIDKLKVSNREYREKNKERIAIYDAKYGAKNRNKINERNKLWLASRPGKNSAYMAQRRGRKLNATPSWADQKSIQNYYILAKFMTEFTGEKWVVDHVVPLQSKNVCGLHAHTNLAVITAFENGAKHNKYWPDMPCHIN